MAFIERILLKFGFHPCWVNLVMTCIKSSSFSVLVNNEPGPIFKPNCGLRQGDSIAPFIFILAMEFFARSLQLESIKPNHRVGIKVAQKGKCIPFLSFADDTIIFANATARNA